jgi:hypothetical protein
MKKFFNLAMYFLYALIGLVAVLGTIAITVLCFEVIRYQKHKLKLKQQNSEKPSTSPGKLKVNITSYTQISYYHSYFFSLKGSRVK